QTYHYNLDSAAALFSNAWNGIAPQVTISTEDVVISTTNQITGTAPADELPCTPSAPAAPAAPAADPRKLKRDDHPGKNDVVGDNQCAFLNGTSLTGLTYTQEATATSTCTYKTYQQN